MNDRDHRGRFIPGNRVCYSGWAGLVAGPFYGDTAAAKAWFAQLGRCAYAQQCLLGTRFEYRLLTIWKHPGQPCEFMESWRRSLSFTLADVPEREF